MLDKRLNEIVNDHLYRKIQIRRMLNKKIEACLYHGDTEEMEYLLKQIGMLDVV